MSVDRVWEMLSGLLAHGFGCIGMVELCE